jgi:phosphoenolpyruvate-protein kinase (PTS system EI component)
LRGLRYCLAHPELFGEQLLALCLASRRGELKILLPMVTSLSEIAAARSLLQKAAYRAGLDEPPAMGVMVEVPSAALLADRLAELADFFSIGTNDLTQYGLAVDRADPDVSPLYRPLHPAILRLIAMVVDAGSGGGRPVAVCGELAGDPVGAAVLVGLGLRDLSATPVAIPRVKEHLCAVDAARLRGLAEKALESSDASEVTRLFGSERS